MGISKYFASSTPTKVLFIFVFVVQFFGTLYYAHQLSLPPLFEFLSRYGWLKEDCRRTGETWPIDLGMFLYVAWIFILPYHMFKTRGTKAFIGIFALIGVYITALVTAAIMSELFAG